MNNKSLLKILLKTKNEPHLIETWLLYHAKLVGWQNIIVFDNHSDDENVSNVYNKYRDSGLLLLTVDGFANKVNSYNEYKEFYELLFTTTEYFTVLDTDEFLCSYTNNRFSSNVLDIVENSGGRCLGSIWYENNYHDGKLDSLRYCRPWLGLNGHKIESIQNGKGIYSTRYQNLRNIIYSHNYLCDDIFYDERLSLLHFAHTNIDIRIRNCVNMLYWTSVSGFDTFNAKVLSNYSDILGDLCLRGIYNEKILSIELDYHKLHEVQEYYSNIEEYLRKNYTFDDEEYIYTNIIDHVINGTEYQQVIKEKHE